MSRVHTFIEHNKANKGENYILTQGFLLIRFLKVGLRVTAMSGALLSTLGLALSAIFHTNISVLYLTYGLMFGSGASLIYTPSLTVLGGEN